MITIGSKWRNRFDGKTREITNISTPKKVKLIEYICLDCENNSKGTQTYDEWERNADAGYWVINSTPH